MAIRGNVSIMRETSLTYLLNVRMIDFAQPLADSATFDRLFVAKSKASHIRPGDCDSFLFHGGGGIYSTNLLPVFELQKRIRPGIILRVI